MVFDLVQLLLQPRRANGACPGGDKKRNWHCGNSGLCEKSLNDEVKVYEKKLIPSFKN